VEIANDLHALFASQHPTEQYSSFKGYCLIHKDNGESSEKKKRGKEISKLALASYPSPLSLCAL
jgi:hypothetical protein